MSDTLVYLVRHTQPLLPDARKRFLGWSDPPLSATGVEQAHTLGERLQAVRFDSIWSSDLQRCVMTAEIVAADLARLRWPASPEAEPDPTMPVRLDTGLREINAGLWDGLTFDEAAERYPEESAERERDLTGFRFPGGESFRDLRTRVLPAFSRIVDEGGANILVVAHMGVNRVLLCEFLQLPFEELFSISQAHGHVNVIAVTVRPGGSRRIEVLPSPGGSLVGQEP